jgi:hypothetical protein
MEIKYVDDQFVLWYDASKIVLLPNVGICSC